MVFVLYKSKVYTGTYVKDARIHDHNYPLCHQVVDVASKKERSRGLTRRKRAGRPRRQSAIRKLEKACVGIDHDVVVAVVHEPSQNLSVLSGRDSLLTPSCFEVFGSLFLRPNADHNYPRPATYSRDRLSRLF